MKTLLAGRRRGRATMTGSPGVASIAVAAALALGAAAVCSAEEPAPVPAHDQRAHRPTGLGGGGSGGGSSISKKDRIDNFALEYSCSDRGENTCSRDSDCQDPSNARGGDPGCGDAYCDARSGTCVYNIYREDCPDFRECGDWSDGSSPRPVNERCVGGGPSSVGPLGAVEGRCIGHLMNECVYAWCPPMYSSSKAKKKSKGTFRTPTNQVRVSWPNGGSSKKSKLKGDDGDSKKASAKRDRKSGSGKDGDGDGETATVTTIGPTPDPADLEYLEYICTTDLVGASRFLYGEPEMERLIHALEQCTLNLHPEADVESVEVLDQEYVAGSPTQHRRERGLGRGRRRLAKNVRTKARKSWCKRCKPGNNLPGSDRALAAGGHLHYSTRRLEEAYDKCMLDLLSVGVAPENKDLGAFLGLSQVSTTCVEPGVLHNHDPAAETVVVRLGDHPIPHTHDDSAASGIFSGQGEAQSINEPEDEEVECITTLEGTGVPMLAQRELVFFDECFMNVFNDLHYDESNPDASEMIVGSVVFAQKPQGSDAAAAARDVHRDLEREGNGAAAHSVEENSAGTRILGAKWNEARNKVKRCKRCEKIGLTDDSGRRVLQLRAGTVPDLSAIESRDEDGDVARGTSGSSSQQRLIRYSAEFNSRLGACLRSGRDPETPSGAGPYNAFFSPDLKSETLCEMTVGELAEQADAERAFEESREREEANFEEYLRAKEEHFFRAQQAEREEFNKGQKEKRMKFLQEWDGLGGGDL
mmetsp:Transcript_55835/g.167348  ORF Transcript_55835/g.167348 Transcript_55835/m.167348 type:complete len:756 (-) Transcript_55835:370-2637(-)